MPCPATAGAVFRLGRPFKWASAEFAGDFTETLRLFGGALLGAVEFDETASGLSGSVSFE